MAAAKSNLRRLRWAALIAWLLLWVGLVAVVVLGYRHPLEWSTTPFDRYAIRIDGPLILFSRGQRFDATYPSMPPTTALSRTHVRWDHDPDAERQMRGTRLLLPLWPPLTSGSMTVTTDAASAPGESQDLELFARALSSWLLIVLASLPGIPLTWLLWRYRRRARAGACRKCGYDLRATPDRCPSAASSRPTCDTRRGGLGRPLVARSASRTAAKAALRPKPSSLTLPLQDPRSCLGCHTLVRQRVVRSRTRTTRWRTKVWHPSLRRTAPRTAAKTAPMAKFGSRCATFARARSAPGSSERAFFEN